MDELPVPSSNFLREESSTVFFMAANRPLTAETIARNLNFLMEKYSYSEKEVERRSGVSSKTVNNMRNAKHKPTVENTDLVAGVFKLDGWQLLVPGMPAELIESSQLKETITNYASSNAEGRKAIDRVAEREAIYSKQATS